MIVTRDSIIFTKPLFLLVAIIFCCLVLFVFWEPLMRNRRMLHLRQLDSAQATHFTKHADTPNGQRALGLLAMQTGDYTATAAHWALAGGDAADLLIFGRIAADRYPPDAPNEQNALNWYRAAVLLDDSNPDIWFAIQRECQLFEHPTSICEEAVVRNDSNYLVNVSFEYGLQAWSFGDDQAAYALESCDDTHCLKIIVPPETEPYRATALQCFHLAGGQTVTFSADIKVETAPDTIWRPLYAQGRADGIDRGAWAKGMVGSADWQRYEHQFRNPDYDDGQACFHPVRLAGAGTAWFANPIVTVTEGQP